MIDANALIHWSALVLVVAGAVYGLSYIHSVGSLWRYFRSTGQKGGSDNGHHPHDT